MRVTTIAFQRNSINGLNDIQEALNQRQLQLSTGERIQRISDDPIASAQIQRLEQELSVIDTNQKNSDAAERHLASEESVLKQYTNVLVRLKELAVQAGNVEALSQSDRASIGREMHQRLKELEGLANTQSAQGEYIFSGYQSQTKPMTQDTTGRYNYNGDDGQRFIKVGTDSQVATNDSASNVFLEVPATAGSYQTSVTSTNTGNGLISLGELSDVTAWQTSIATDESYTLTFNPAGNTFDVVADSAPGVPLAGLDDVPYVAGNNITVAGITFTLSGTPQPGDSFRLRQNPNQDIFTTASRISNTLITQNDTSIVRFEVDNALGNIDNALEVANSIRSEVGSRLNTIDSERIVNSDLKIASETTISRLKAVDYPEVISEISQLTFALEASQRTYVNIQSLQLFNFLR